MSHTVQVLDTLCQGTAAEIDRGLAGHNEKFVGQNFYRPLNVVARDDVDRNFLVGGAMGYTSYGWLHLTHLFVAESRRGQGVGSRLLEEAEAEAARRGCCHAHLSTFDFQARAFYEERGYTTFGLLDDFPAGHELYFMRKTLPRATAWTGGGS